MRTIAIDGTEREGILLDGELLAREEDGCGKLLAARLAALELGAEDVLQVVSGPGHMTGLRIAATCANMARMVTGCCLEEKRKDEEAWRSVTQITPYYAEEVKLGKRN